MTHVVCNPEAGTANAQFEFDYEMSVTGVNVKVANEKITFFFAFADEIWALCGIESEAFGKN
jgi:hypothetical protein